MLSYKSNVTTKTGNGNTVGTTMPTTDIKKERDELYHYCYGLIGFLQLIKERDDVSAELMDVMRTNHRVADAAAYLTQIVPPNGD